MLPKTIQYKRHIIKIRYIGRKESQDLDCVGMFIPSDNEILIYKNQSIKNILITFLHELYHLLCSKDNINVGKCGEEKLVDKLSESFVRLLIHNPKLLGVFQKLLK
jgi:Zn-dependent peptidase ImmA (M78 family)|tara:strand:- start:506 stop:823 length:318 start_codon:yes stop_codon:yes gene_type:complete